jgi:hypothetical protein
MNFVIVIPVIASVFRSTKNQNEPRQIIENRVSPRETPFPSALNVFIVENACKV